MLKEGRLYAMFERQWLSMERGLHVLLGADMYDACELYANHP